MRRFLNILNWVLILGLVVAALWAWPRLPPQIPTHFGADGQADAWGDRTLESWFMAPGIALLLIAIMASPFLMVVFFLGLQRAMDRGKKLAAATAGPSKG